MWSRSETLKCRLRPGSAVWAGSVPSPRPSKPENFSLLGDGRAEQRGRRGVGRSRMTQSARARCRAEKAAMSRGRQVASVTKNHPQPTPSREDNQLRPARAACSLPTRRLAWPSGELAEPRWRRPPAPGRHSWEPCWL